MTTEKRTDALQAGRSSIGRCFADTGRKPRAIKVDPQKREKGIVRDMLEGGEIHAKRARIMLKKITVRYSEMCSGQYLVEE